MVILSVSIVESAYFIENLGIGGLRSVVDRRGIPVNEASRGIFGAQTLELIPQEQDGRCALSPKV